MANEDFTGYTEVDEGADVTVTASKIDFDGLDRNETTYVYDDKGAAHFDGDFTHKYELLFENGGSGRFNFWWVLANSLGGFKSLENASEDALGHYVYGTTSLGQTICENGTRNNDSWGSAVEGTVYFMEVVRDDALGANNTGLLTTYIRTGSHTGELKDTLTDSCAAGEQNDFRYVYGLCGYDDGSSGYARDGYTQNMDLGEAAGATTKPTHAYPLGMDHGMNIRMP